MIVHHQLHLAARAGVAHGGTELAALRYAQSIARAGCVVTLLARQFPGESDRESLEVVGLELKAAPVRNNFFLELFDQYRFIKKFCEQGQISLIHLHGMWSPILAIGALVARRARIPLVISPHGCLEPWTLGYKHRKKALALRTYQGASLRSASLFVATANQEATSIRRLGLRQPVAIIPNGVDISALPRRNLPGEVKTILFLSRIHPVKGLLDLVEAWAAVRQPGWRIVIAGSDEQGHRAEVESLIRAKGLESEFVFTGYVAGERKQACLDDAVLFVLPTYSENFGIAIAEALAAELPVITTTGAPWRELVEYRCGWWVEPGVQGVSNALLEAIESDPVELRQMGKRGRQLVIEKYSWPKIGSMALEVSEWLLDPSRPKPAVVDSSTVQSSRHTDMV